MRTLQALQSCGAEFGHIDVIAEPQYRQALPEYSRWPTFPQVFINGELVGDCDIVLGMYQSGDLQRLADASVAEPAYLTSPAFLIRLRAGARPHTVTAAALVDRAQRCVVRGELRLCRRDHGQDGAAAAFRARPTLRPIERRRSLQRQGRLPTRHRQIDLSQQLGIEQCAV